MNDTTSPSPSKFSLVLVLVIFVLLVSIVAVYFIGSGWIAKYDTTPNPTSQPTATPQATPPEFPPAGITQDELDELFNPSNANEVVLTSEGFTPEHVEIAVDTYVKWTNNDTLEHEITFSGEDLPFTIYPGGQTTRLFKSTGSFTFTVTGVDTEGSITVK